MKKSEWTEEQLENLLKQLPKINDHRNPQDIYQNISTKINKHKRTRWVFSSVATAAALLLIFILFPSINHDKTTDQMIKNSASSQEAVEKRDMSLKQKAESPEEKTNIATKSFSEDRKKLNEESTPIEATAVYANDVTNKDVLTYAIPDNDVQNIVPITVLVDKDPNKKWLTQYVDTMKQLQEEAWGLKEFYPLNGEISYGDSEDIVMIKLPKNHSYGVGSASDKAFTEALTQSFHAQNIKKIKFFTEKKVGVDLGNMGTIEELIVKPSKQHAYFILHSSNKSKPYLVPSVIQFKSIGDAIIAMKKEIEEYKLMPSIPAEINLEIANISDNVNKGILTVAFDKNTILSNSEQMIYMIESILLTAKEFDFKAVKFENAGINKIGPFKMTDAIQVPIAPNLKTITTK